MHIAVAQLCHGQVHADSSMCFSSLLLHSQRAGIRVSPGKATASIVGNARNAAVAGAKAAGATHVLMIDSDMIYPQCLLEEYVKHDVPVMGCPYRRRGPPYGMMGVPEEGQDLAALAANQSPVRFTWLATGLMMIRLDVFDSMTQPFFYHPADPESGYAGGEDLQFCAALREAEVPIHGLVHLERVGHIIEGVLWNDTANILPVELYDQLKREAADGAGPR